MESKKSLYTVYAVTENGVEENFNIEADSMFDAITKFNERFKAYPGKTTAIYPRITKITSSET